MQFITSDHISLHYTDTGENNYQPIIFIPGIGGNYQLFSVASKLFHQKFRVIILEPRNQGLSQRTQQGQRISRHAADVAELITNLKLTNVVAIGNSMGAAIFWAYLSLYGKKNIAAMVDLDQSPKMINDENWQYGFKELTWDNYPQYLKKPFEKATYAHIERNLVAAVKAVDAKRPYDPAKNYLCLIDHAEQDWRDVIKTAPVPMLVIAGEKSPYFDYHFIDAIHDLNSKIKIKVIPNCGHIVQLEKPKEMHDLVISFLKNKS